MPCTNTIIYHVFIENRTEIPSAKQQNDLIKMEKNNKHMAVLQTETEIISNRY